MLIIRDCDGYGEISADDVILIATKNALGEITYKSVSFNEEKDAIVDNEAEAIWTLEEQNAPDGGWYYGLVSKNTERYLTVDADGTSYSIVKTVGNSNDKLTQKALDEAETKFRSSYFFTGKSTDGIPDRLAKDNNVLRSFAKNMTGAGVGNVLVINGGENEVTIQGKVDNAGIILATLASRTVDYVDELNDIKGGKGFQFSVQSEAETVIDNIFDDLDLRAFRVDGGLSWEANGHSYFIPGGTYLATDWTGVDEDILVDNTFSQDEHAEFQKLTLVAVSPTDYTEITNTKRADGIGFTLTTVKGSSFNFYNAAVDKVNDIYDENLESKGDEVYIANACFTVTVPAPAKDNDAYQLSLANVRLDLAGKGTQAPVGKTIYVSAVDNTNNVEDVTDEHVYMVTNTNKDLAVTLEAVPSSTIADATELLNKEATPAIYAVKFLSGEDEESSEYGQYLTVITESNKFVPAIMPSVNNGANENDPLYQFVVTGVANNDGDKKAETITLTNRQTQQVVSFILYSEEELGDNVYTIYPTATTSTLDVAYTKDDELAFLQDQPIQGMIVELIKKENVDKFATFETAKSEEGLYTFEFAKTAESGDRLYAAAYRNAKGEIEYTYTEGVVTSETPDQFELIRVKDSEGDKISYILNDFVYISNDRVISSEIARDTVAAYSYHIRFFAPDEKVNEYYLAQGKLAANAIGEKCKGSEFIIKYNLDGSVSLFDSKDGLLIKTNQPNAAAKYLEVKKEIQDLGINKEEEDLIDIPAWDSKAAYNVIATYNKPVKTFMVPETVYGTLNPVPQTTEFENVDGFGYLNMNDNKQAILLPSESMTFRLDTVDTDSNIPSFYISKDNNFLYFAQDSADSERLTNWSKYWFDNGSVSGEENRSTRLIFKAGELINDSQALQTMANGKSVVIEEEVDRVSGALGGLNYFKFQVLESEDGDDTYVIRNKQTRDYVIAINGNLTLGSNRDGATRFVVNPQEATANEDAITVSSVKVIAGNGQITIAGAAGKKVVVSNILGQVVANTVLTSDNATIAAPQGIVVVAVEGEEAVKAIVK